MKGDFSTYWFKASKHYNRVLKQQGRVDLDSDWNAQAAIVQHHQRTLIVDLFGPAAGPQDNCGFGLGDPAALGFEPTVGDFILKAGRYYVNGLMVENDQAVPYSMQPALPTPDKLGVGKSYIAYLDVWERHITYIEDDSIREVALGGPDTATRVKTIWQVKVIESSAAQAQETKAAQKKRLAQAQTAQQAAAAPASGGPTPAPAPQPVDCDSVVDFLQSWTSGTMTARLEPSDPSDTPCVLAPESRYRGLENHLYRIEIHAGGDTTDPNKVPTFKWSRENGSIASRWLDTTAGEVRVANSRGFVSGGWVEFTSEIDDLLGNPGPLALVTKVDGDALTAASAPALQKDAKLPKVRAWDQKANDELSLTNGAIAIAPGSGDQGWIKIEAGIEVQFSPGQYRTGDYWLIPARVATGAIEWPADVNGNEMALPPLGITHYYAPLFTFDALGKDPFVELTKDCRCRFAPLLCVPPPKT